MSLLAAIQTACKTQLDAQEYFSDSEADTPQAIPVLTEQLKDIEKEIDIAINKLGLCVLILTAVADDAITNAKLYWESIRVICAVYEQPQLEATGLPPAAEVAEAIAWHLHHHKPSTSNALVHTRIVLVPDDDYIIYNVEFVTSGGINAAPART